VLTGGGAHNAALWRALKKLLPGELILADELGWPGDALEAQAFAYLAVRSLRGLPLSYPSTTGVSEPTAGGVFAQCAELELVEVDEGE
jgi:anhydro-N-acetylmuramic acid kinase